MPVPVLADGSVTAAVAEGPSELDAAVADGDVAPPEVSDVVCAVWPVVVPAPADPELAEGVVAESAASLEHAANSMAALHANAINLER